MRKIIQPLKEELYCDGCQKCLDWGESLETRFHFGYDSKKDLTGGSFIFCSDCSESVLDFMQEKWKIKLDDDQDGVYK